MTLRLEVAELGLAALDALDVDALAVPVGDSRPLVGLAAYVDWRLCGAISRPIRSGLFDPMAGEALLSPSGGRLRVPRVFCFGLPREPLDGPGFAEAAGRIVGAMVRARSTAWATALPPAEPDVPSARLWLEASLRAPAERQVLLGDARALLRDLQAAGKALGADAVVAPVPAHPAPHGAGLPVRSAVIR